MKNNLLLKYKVSIIIDDLLNHNITKLDACEKISALYNTDITNINVTSALKASVFAIYFADNSDYKSYHYDVIRCLTGLTDLDDNQIKILFDELSK
jgi:hypothetical protein